MNCPPLSAHLNTEDVLAIFRRLEGAVLPAPTAMSLTCDYLAMTHHYYALLCMFACDRLGVQCNNVLKRPSCSNNPAVHWELTGDWTVECISPLDEQRNAKTRTNPTGNDNSLQDGDRKTASLPSAWPSVAYALVLAGSDEAAHNFEVRRAYLAKHDIELRKFDAVNGQQEFGNRFSIHTMEDGVDRFSYLNPVTQERITEKSPEFLKPGELGYTASMKRVMMAAQAEQLPQVMVIDDDAIFTCNFAEDLKRVLAQTRCAGPADDDLGQ